MLFSDSIGEFSLYPKLLHPLATMWKRKERGAQSGTHVDGSTTETHKQFLRVVVIGQ